MYYLVFMGFCCMLLSGSAAPALWTGLRVEQPSYSYEGCYDYTISGTIRPTVGGNVYVQGLLYGHEENDSFFLKSYDYSETVAVGSCWTWPHEKTRSCMIGLVDIFCGSSTAKASRGGAETRRFDGFSDGIGIYALDVRKDVLHQLGEG